VTTKKPPPEEAPSEQPDGAELPGNERKERDAENDPTVIDESPADEEGNRPERDREDPNTYPDPDNPSHTP